ncbi:hypothetical protein HOY80DRAFT_1135115 [Tuber brumale]|nr:hypothetical protein HOY80DRAFT_1135115 [Tuber brumale]
MLMSARERAITSANILAAFRVASQQSPTRTSEVDEIAKLEVQALQSHNIDQIKATVTEIALIGWKSLASANMNAELLKQEKEKRQASKTDRRIISKARVIGLWELAQLKKKKKLAGEMKKKEKQKKKLEIGLDTTTIRRRISLTKEQQGLSQNGGRILEDENVTTLLKTRTDYTTQPPLVQSHHLRPPLKRLPNEHGDPGPSTQAFRNQDSRL